MTFPLLAKTDVNGDDRHPLYTELTKALDSDGQAGDIQWNLRNPSSRPTVRCSIGFAPAPDRTHPTSGVPSRPCSPDSGRCGYLASTSHSNVGRHAVPAAHGGRRREHGVVEVDLPIGKRFRISSSAIRPSIRASALPRQ